MNLPLTGVPYAFPSDPPRSFDCWTLMVYLRGQLGLWTPAIDARWEPETVVEAIAVERERWEPVETPFTGCVALMNDAHVGLLLHHVIAHATPTTGVLYTPVRAAKRRFPGLRYFRPCR